MKRFGWAIKTGGDPEIAGALAAGIQSARVDGSEAVRRVAMMQHTPGEWAEMVEEARVVYGGRKFAPLWARVLLAGYGLVCYGVALAFRKVTRGVM